MSIKTPAIMKGPEMVMMLLAPLNGTAGIDMISRR